MQTQRQRKTAGTANGARLDQESVVVWDRNGLVVVWPDGHRTSLAWTEIRRACQCVVCHGQQERQQTLLASAPQE